ncbi:MAG: hypothetical protein LBP53_01005 [Candidatus Peribacteria bacterium]|jgi:hypothetical protein|nr:hypothetical protein [Candidatus Peribacteria bacterium]
MTTYTSRETYQFISRQTNDPIVEWKTCTVSGQPFPIYQSDVDFYEKISPTFDGKKFLIPTPTLCPEERQRRRLAFRNERKLYRRTCDFSGKEIISMYSPDKPFKVYEQEILWSDQWNPLDYGKDINWNVSFFQQFNELLHTIPLPSLITKMSENCKYVNNCGNSKNSYLIFDSDFCENSLYSSIVKYSNSVLDSLHIYHCENIYNSINCTESYHLINCFECDRSKFLRNCSKCINCEYCYGCSNLVYKKYCIYNQPYSQEEYEKRILEIPFTYEYPSSLSRTTYVLNSEESIGNNLWNTKQCHFSFNV